MRDKNMPTVDVPKGSEAAILTATLYGADGQPKNLTGSDSAVVYVKDGSNNQITNGAPATILDQTTNRGEVQYQLTATEVASVRKLYADFRIINLNGAGNGNLVSEMYLLNVRDGAKV